MDIPGQPRSLDANSDGIPDECDAPACRADYDENGHIEPADVSLFITQWYEDLNGTTLRTDFDLNLRIQTQDLALFVSVWFANANNPACQ